MKPKRNVTAMEGGKEQFRWRCALSVIREAVEASKNTTNEIQRRESMAQERNHCNELTIATSFT